MKKYRVAADTSSLISLHLADLWKLVFRHFTFMIGEKIKKELEDMAKIKDRLGIAAGSILKLIDDNIKLKKIPKKFRRGEDEALEIMRTFECDFLLSDDVEFVKKANRKYKNVHYTIFVIYILYRMNEISLKDVQDAVDSIFRERRWPESLIYIFVKHLLKEE